jgi:nitric oxide reductase large subunit
MGKAFESLLGFCFVALPWVVIAAIGYINSWDYVKAIQAIPLGDPFSLAALIILAIYGIALIWVISKAIRVSKIKKESENPR